MVWSACYSYVDRYTHTTMYGSMRMCECSRCSNMHRQWRHQLASGVCHANATGEQGFKVLNISNGLFHVCRMGPAAPNFEEVCVSLADLCKVFVLAVQGVCA